MNLRLATPFVALSLSLAACSDSDEPGDNASESDFGSFADEGERKESDLPPVDGIPGWLPDDFPLPDDFEPFGARDFIGNRHVLEGDTQMPLDQTYDFFADGLTKAGYEVRTRDSYREQNLVYFKGHGCEDCTIRSDDLGDSRRINIALHYPNEE